MLPKIVLPGPQLSAQCHAPRSQFLDPPILVMMSETEISPFFIFFFSSYFRCEGGHKGLLSRAGDPCCPTPATMPCAVWPWPPATTARKCLPATTPHVSSSLTPSQAEAPAVTARPTGCTASRRVPLGHYRHRPSPAANADTL